MVSTVAAVRLLLEQLDAKRLQNVVTCNSAISSCEKAAVAGGLIDMLYFPQGFVRLMLVNNG